MKKLSGKSNGLSSLNTNADKMKRSEGIWDSETIYMNTNAQN